jgi:methylated-DNA-[protein]-cysteine S-methyltransferase
MTGSKEQQLWLDRVNSAIGEILLISDGTALCALDFADYEARMWQLLSKHYPQFTLHEQKNPQGFSDCLRAYLQGDLQSLDSIPVNPGGTSFQQQVWVQLRTIAPGTTLSYGQLAQRLGYPTAARAVGLANSLNPVSIVVPCHRVVGSNGKLTGYAGGLDRKRWLLEHEQGIKPLFSHEVESLKPAAC